MPPEALPHGVDVDVQHHHHEQEQHHHGAQVHQHERDGQELGLQQQPDGGGLREREDQVEHRMHGVARGDDPEGRIQQHDREQIEETSLGVHESDLVKSGSGAAGQRYLASAALAAAISAS